MNKCESAHSFAITRGTKMRERDRERNELLRRRGRHFLPLQSSHPLDLFAGSCTCTASPLAYKPYNS